MISIQFLSGAYFENIELLHGECGGAGLQKGPVRIG